VDYHQKVKTKCEALINLIIGIQVATLSSSVTKSNFLLFYFLILAGLSFTSPRCSIFCGNHSILSSTRSS